MKYSRLFAWIPAWLLLAGFALAETDAPMAEGASAHEEALANPMPALDPEEETEVVALPAPDPEEEPAEEGSKGDENEVQPLSVGELVGLIDQGLAAEREENLEREREFIARREAQSRLLAEAEQVLAREEAGSERLEGQYARQETELETLETRLTERVGALGELFGVVRQVSNDFAGQSWESLISSQVGERKELLDRLGRSTELPTTEDLLRLWFELQREITEQGKVARYRADVVSENGETREQEVIRAGPFSAIADGRYLAWEAPDQRLRELPRQPPSRYVSTAEGFGNASGGHALLAVDPSRGSLLSALTATPTWTERVEQGGYVGYAVILLGLLALGLGGWRWFVIQATGKRVVEQQQHIDRPDSGNPLGRLLSVYEQNRGIGPEGLELKLDEATLRETSQLERFLWLVKTGSVVAPLLGLLGTVTGMIQTFRAITLFGAGDPKMMAGGISEALVTTMLGLITAIPLVLLHATLANNTRRIRGVLDEHVADLVALESEGLHGEKEKAQ